MEDPLVRKRNKDPTMVDDVPEDYWTWIGRNRESFLIG